ncbi:hypothetical protein Pmani_003623 [Petrolisthes manimaculis]|uniref:Uncharacterized protein n=1 Tax=Petrolisthes manimaculis TaxID=1843537 RepID=A0AAE1UJB7_9EUCA|nr:hypothetical protein Pmani_003623 [Petrolisthes manimaculis]
MIVSSVVSGEQLMPGGVSLALLYHQTHITQREWVTMCFIRSGDWLSLEDLAQFAEEFMDTIPNETNICNITSSNEVSQLKYLISSLTEQVS